MKIIFKLAVLLSMLGLTACSVSGSGVPGLPDFGGGGGGLGGKPDAIANQALQGTMGGTPWTMTKAVGEIQSDGMLMVSISGNGEVINCSYKNPLKPGLLFSIPMKVAEHDFDMLRPDGGYAVTWVYRDTNSNIQNVFSDMAHISITSVTSDRMLGGLSAKFLDPSNSGTLNGLFEITICP